MYFGAGMPAALPWERLAFFYSILLFFPFFLLSLPAPPPLSFLALLFDYAYAYLCVWRPEFGPGCLPRSLSTLVLETVLH